MLLPTVPARVPRDLSAVGKTPKKSRRQKLQLYFPGTVPRRREALLCSAPPGVLPVCPLTALWEKFLHPLVAEVPLQIENTLSEMDLYQQSGNLWEEPTTPKQLLRSSDNYVWWTINF